MDGPQVLKYALAFMAALAEGLILLGVVMTFDFHKISSILVCPKSRADLVLDGNFLISTCPQSRLRFSIVDEITRLIVEEAETLDPSAWATIMQANWRDAQTGAVLQSA